MQMLLNVKSTLEFIFAYVSDVIPKLASYMVRQGIRSYIQIFSCLKYTRYSYSESQRAKFLQLAI